MNNAISVYTPSARQLYRLFFISLVLSVFTTCLSVRTHKQFYDLNCYRPDPANGFLRHAETYADYRQNGLGKTILFNLEQTTRSPIETSLPLLLNPGLLTSPLVQLTWNAPLLLLFCFFLGLRILKVTTNLPVAVAAIVLYSTSLVLYAPYFGIAFQIPDTPAGYLLGLAGLFFLLWRDHNNLRWLIPAGLCAGLCVLYRYATCMYVFIVFAPLFAGQAIRDIHRGVRWLHALRPVALFGACTLVVCGVYVGKGYDYFFNYYTFWMNVEHGNSSIGIARSFLTITRATLGFFGLWHLVLFAVFLSALFLLSQKAGSRRFSPTVLWTIFAVPGFLILYGQSDGSKVTSALLSYFPLLFAGAIGIFQTKIHTNHRLAIGVSIFILACLTSAARSVNKGARLISPDPYKAVIKKYADTIHNRTGGSATHIVGPSNPMLTNALRLEVFFRGPRSFNRGQAEQYFDRLSRNDTIEGRAASLAYYRQRLHAEPGFVLLGADTDPGFPKIEVLRQAINQRGAKVIDSTVSPKTWLFLVK